MKHTPGPWNDVIHDQSEARLFTHDHRFIARISGLDLSRAEDRANVRLIAAAPELLATLERLLSIANDGAVMRHETGKPAWSFIDEVKTQARAAINKATQES